MLEVCEAQSLLKGQARPVEAQEVELGQAAGRFLSEPVVAPRAAPPYRCAAMDGWAVRSGDVGPRRSVAPPAWAGDGPGRRLGPGEAVRIFTGAPVPEGADAVCPEELADDEWGTVVLKAAVRPGEHVREEGEDVAVGSVAVPAGSRLGPRAFGLCAGLGIQRVRVRRVVRVALLATGDELVRGRIGDSNGQAIGRALQALGCEVDYRLVPDDAPVLREAFAAALRAPADLVLSTGGVSVGEKDLVPAAVAALGARTLFHGVAMKPGKPAFAAELGGRLVLGLPGSPSACLVAFEVLARPVVLALSGAVRLERRCLGLPLATDLDGRPGRTRFHWARLTDGGAVEPLGRDTAQLRGPALADVLLQVPATVGALAVGARVDAWLLEEAAP